MAEEKKLDMAGVAQDAAEAERVAEEAKQEQETGSYTHTFKNPFPWNGKNYEKLTFDWSALDGGDYLEIESEIVMKGRTLVSPEFTGEFLAGMAARACPRSNVTSWQGTTAAYRCNGWICRCASSAGGYRQPLN